MKKSNIGNLMNVVIVVMITLLVIGLLCRFEVINFSFSLSDNISQIEEGIKNFFLNLIKST